MNIHEYQAKQIFRKYNLKVLNGQMVENGNQALQAAQNLGGSPWVVKAQIHAGGRGKGGGVKIAKSLNEVKTFTDRIIGMNLVTHQTGPEGKEVNKVYIEQACQIEKEYYCAVFLDRSSSKISIMASSQGGMDIEEVARKTPGEIHTFNIESGFGVQDFQVRNLAFKLGFKGKQALKAAEYFKTLYEIYIKEDCNMVEINPLVTTKEGDIIALDAKMSFDSNALYRHPDILDLRDLSEEDPAEVEASKYNLAFIKLNGNIGCLVNGAGLAMATMDIIKLHGAEPANFLDVGGGATKENVIAAFKIILKDFNVKGILVNIFGGIMKCDIIAEGIIAAVKEVGLNVPLVVRLEGTNVEFGQKILSESDLNVTASDSLTDAAKKVVHAVKGV